MIEGRCLSYGASIPYLPLFELVRHACGIIVDDSPDRVASKIELRVKALELDISLAHYLRHAFGATAEVSGVASDATFGRLSERLLPGAQRRGVCRRGQAMVIATRG